MELPDANHGHLVVGPDAVQRRRIMAARGVIFLEGVDQPGAVGDGPASAELRQAVGKQHLREERDDWHGHQVERRRTSVKSRQEPGDDEHRDCQRGTRERKAAAPPRHDISHGPDNAGSNQARARMLKLWPVVQTAPSATRSSMRRAPATGRQSERTAVQPAQPPVPPPTAPPPNRRTRRGERDSTRRT